MLCLKTAVIKKQTRWNAARYRSNAFLLNSAESVSSFITTSSRDTDQTEEKLFKAPNAAALTQSAWPWPRFQNERDELSDIQIFYRRTQDERTHRMKPATLTASSHNQRRSFPENYVRTKLGGAGREWILPELSENVQRPAAPWSDSPDREPRSPSVRARRTSSQVDQRMALNLMKPELTETSQK